MIKKLRQILNDHRAMQIFRRHFGDVLLVSFIAGGMKQGYECYIFQHTDWCETDQDPAIAILKAYETWANGDIGCPAQVPPCYGKQQ